MYNMNDIIIIGGGVSGLYILEQLTNQYSNLKIKLLERDNRIGGRILTKYYKDGKVKFETGPWRFHDSHQRVKKLVHKYNLETRINSSSHPDSYKKKISKCFSEHKKSFKNNPKKGLSFRDVSLLDEGMCSTYQRENFIKTPLIFDSSSKPYDVNLSYQGEYFVLTEGLSSLVKKISNKKESYIDINCLVENVQRRNKVYEISFRKRVGNNYYPKKIKCHYLFLCLPPKECLQWSIVQENLLPLIHSVDTIPLNHIYGYSSQLSTFFNNSFYIKTDSDLSEIISGDFNNNWFQISYSGGENARFFERLKQVKPNLLRKIVKSRLQDAGVNIPISKIESFYWEHAIHIWKPGFHFNIDKSMRKSVYPHPVNLCNLFYAGEAFSTTQGWIEGALETSEIALSTFNALRQNQFIFRPISIKKEDQYVILDNRYLDVHKWKIVHPGSTQAIQNHLREDISKLFRHIKHSHYSWLVVNHIQTYWVLNNKIGYFEIKKNK